MVFRISLLLDILGSDGLVAGVGGVESAQGQADHPAHQGGDHSTEKVKIQIACLHHHGLQPFYVDPDLFFPCYGSESLYIF